MAPIRVWRCPTEEALANHLAIRPNPGKSPIWGTFIRFLYDVWLAVPPHEVVVDGVEHTADGQALPRGGEVDNERDREQGNRNETVHDGFCTVGHTQKIA